MSRTLAAKLDEAVSHVAPISGVSIGRRDLRETWSVNFTPEATPEQIAAAQAVLASFVEQDDPEPPRELAPLNVDEVIELIAHFMPEPRAVQPEPEPAQLLPPVDALMADEPEEVEIDPKDADTIIDGFVGELRTSRDTAEGTMRSMDPPDRRRLFSILNTELGRLKNQEALLGKSIPRRADCEELIGILAKVGEA
jgi:hypothetical protein